MIAIILALILSSIQFTSEYVFERMAHVKHKLITSFAAGVSLSFLFMELLPDYSFKIGSRWMFIWILIGFACYYLVEKYLYKHHAKQASFHHLHSGFTLVYHFALGVVLSQFAKQGNLAVITFFIPVALHLGVSSAVEHHIHFRLAESMKENLFLKLLFALAPLVGVWFCDFFQLSLTNTLIFQGLAIGSLFFIIIRESLPRNNEGEPKWLVLGIAVYTLILYILSHTM